MYTKHEVPHDYLERWQKNLDIAAAMFEVPAALIMRVWPEQIEVLISSVSAGNPYEEHEKADLGSGLYCETVMETRAQLLIPNALEDPKWDRNPDIKLNMVNYLGVPLIWPDQSVFGTMCVLDSKTHDYSAHYQSFLWQLKSLVEADFREISRAAMATERIHARLHELEAEVDSLLLRLGEPTRYKRVH